MKQWLENTLVKLSKKSDTPQSVRYALGRREAPLRYVHDGWPEIDNNAAERALRVVALGRKNYLFAGSDRSGERAAVVYSLIGTAKLNGLDPGPYLREALSRIADHPIPELLPWNLTPQPAHRIAARSIKETTPTNPSLVPCLSPTSLSWQPTARSP
jgi:transposase